MGTFISVDAPFVEDEVKQITSRLRGFDEDIRQILVRRVPLLRRLNDIHSLDRIFPDEILYAIFEHTCILDKDDNLLLPPLILGAVCYRWRQIIWNSPSLWGTTGTIPNPKRPVRPSDVELLRLYFQNVGTHSLSLKLRLDGLSPKQTTQDLIQVFAENSAKIHRLTLSSTNSLEMWRILIAAIRGSRFDKLRSLSFIGRKPMREWFTDLSFHAPHMRSVSFDGLYLSNTQFSFRDVRVLRLKNIAIDRCLIILAQIRTLQEFYCSRTKFEAMPVVLSDVIIMHDLEVFDIDFTYPMMRSCETFFFTHFRFPKLRKLVWGAPLPLSLERGGVTWRPFFSAMDSVVDFTYQSRDYSKRELVGILQGLGPSVRRIRVPSPAAQPKWQSVLNAVQLSMGQVPGSDSLRHIELFLPQQNLIFQKNIGEIKERLRGVGLDVDITGF